MIGLTIPDEFYKLDEKTGHYAIGKINWDEFHNVIKGNGPCNKQRLKHHKKYHQEGAWVREAAEAYSKKQKSKLK